MLMMCQPYLALVVCVMINCFKSRFSKGLVLALLVLIGNPSEISWPICVFDQHAFEFTGHIGGGICMEAHTSEVPGVDRASMYISSCDSDFAEEDGNLQILHYEP